MSGRILIVDAVPTNRIVLRVKLAAAFYDVMQASTGREALRMIRQNRPDVVIASAVLPDMPGQRFCEAVRRDGGGAQLPVILIHNTSDPAERLASLAAGADDVLPRPVDELVMLARLRSLLRARDAEAELQLRDDTRRALGLAEAPAIFQAPARVALIPAGAGWTTAKTLLEDLKKQLSDRVELLSPDVALRDRTLNPDVVVLIEAQNTQGEGLSLLPLLRAHSGTRHAALIYIAHPDQRREAASALDMGASDLLAAGPDAAELALRIQKQVARKRMSDRLRANMRDGLRAAVIDPLTGLYNRRYALPHMGRMAEHAEKQLRPYGLLLADLDHFKLVNDRYGHAAGDAVLKQLALRLRDNLRAADLVARYGGEEFLVVMPDTGPAAAHRTAARLVKLMKEQPISLPDGQEVEITLSIGVAIGQPRDGLTPEDLIDRADRALYAAKNKGRNTVVLADKVTSLTLRKTTQPRSATQPCSAMVRPQPAAGQI